MGVADLLNSQVLFETFFENFRALDDSFDADTAGGGGGSAAN